MSQDPTSARNPETNRDKVKYVLAHIWRGNQREMARALGVSQALISKVANGHQAPGRRLLSALANHPQISAEWIQSGGGPPLVVPGSGSLPIGTGILPGPPLENPQLLSGATHPVADALNRTTRYWIELSAHSPLIREPSLLVAPGDFLLLEADPAWTRRPDMTVGRVCGVRFQTFPGPEYHFGQVMHGPSRLTARLFGKSFVTPEPLFPKAKPASPTRKEPGPTVRRRVRDLDKDEKNARAWELAVEQARRKAAEGLPISQEDIVAVQVYMARPDLTLL